MLIYFQFENCLLIYIIYAYSYLYILVFSFFSFFICISGISIFYVLQYYFVKSNVRIIFIYLCVFWHIYVHLRINIFGYCV